MNTSGSFWAAGLQKIRGSVRAWVMLAAPATLFVLAAVPASATPISVSEVACADTFGEAPPFGNTPCPGVRPGAVVINGRAPVLADTLPPGHCTLGFMFRHRGDTYMSTAGHCAGIAPGAEHEWAPGTGTVVYDLENNRIGEFAYAVLSEELNAVDFDFGLIRLDKGVKASPEICHFGGPTGINSDIVPVTTPVTLHYYGNTIVGGFEPRPVGRWVLPARTAVSTGLPLRNRVYFYGHASLGDSGAPVISADGRAVGVLSAPGEAGPDGYGGLVNVPRLDRQIARAEASLGAPLRLVTV